MKFLVLFSCLLFSDIKAIEPDEILDDYKLEKIAREIGKELRCLVCQNEDIQNSNADIAKDLRKVVRKKLTEGETKEQIITFIHSKYGDFVLFKPPVRFDTLGLWLLPILFFVVLSIFFFRKR
tara:strand:+ start:53 stop:421 length:369 start_codon:yes stop_codon:yes gene_type:complete